MRSPPLRPQVVVKGCADPGPLMEGVAAAAVKRRAAMEAAEDAHLASCAHVLNARRNGVAVKALAEAA